MLGRAKKDAQKILGIKGTEKGKLKLVAETKAFLFIYPYE